MRNNKVCRSEGKRFSIKALPKKMTKAQKEEARELRRALALEAIHAPVRALKISMLIRPIILFSKRSTRVLGSGHCSKCHSRVSLLWKYGESTRGIVYLCSRCQPATYSRSHGGRDALNGALRSSFESKRRKH